MVRTERGRVVYERKKHTFKSSDVERIMRAFAWEYSPAEYSVAVKKTFGSIAKEFAMELLAAMSLMDDIAELGLMFVDGYEEEIQALLDRTIAVPAAAELPRQALRRSAVLSLRRVVLIMEGGLKYVR